MQDQPFVSVVTPVYNGERYLAECIESVLAQTYRAWEYVIVNNCSTDRSLEIAQQYAQKDARIRIVNNQEFVDSHRNHNIAFRQISPESKYCKMVHADDWLFPDCLREMVRVAEMNPAVGIVGSYALYDTKVRLDGLPYTNTVFSGREICRRTLFNQMYLFGSPTSLLIRSDLIRKRNTPYNESNNHADKEFCFDLLKESDFGFVYQVLTYTRLHDQSRTSFSDKFNTYLIGDLITLTKYGPIYLDQKEYSDCLRAHMKYYYSFLANSLLYKRDKQILDYHRKNLAERGFSFSYLKLLGQLLLDLADVLCNPKTTAERALRKAKRTFFRKAAS